MGDESKAMAVLDGKKANSFLSLDVPNTFGSWDDALRRRSGAGRAPANRRRCGPVPACRRRINTGVSCHYRAPVYCRPSAGIAASAGAVDKAAGALRDHLRQAHEIPVILDQPEARRCTPACSSTRGAPATRAKARELLTEARRHVRQDRDAQARRDGRSAPRESRRSLTQRHFPLNTSTPCPYHIRKNHAPGGRPACPGAKTKTAV